MFVMIRPRSLNGNILSKSNLARVYCYKSKRAVILKTVESQTHQIFDTQEHILILYFCRRTDLNFNCMVMYGPNRAHG